MGYSPNYQILVDRVNNVDTFDVKVEMTDAIFGDTITSIKNHEKALAEELKSLLGISANVILVEPNSIERSIGKAVRVIDKRKVIDK